jgi:hypothetical protein
MHVVCDSSSTRTLLNCYRTYLPTILLATLERILYDSHHAWMYYLWISILRINAFLISIFNSRGLPKTNISY